MSNPFAYAELHTDAPAAPKAFYSQLLSWRMEDAPKSDGRYTEIQPGEGLPAGLTQNRYGGGSHWLPYIKVDDLPASTERAKSLGARPLIELQAIPEGRFSVLVDPTGARFGAVASSVLIVSRPCGARIGCSGSCNFSAAASRRRRWPTSSRSRHARSTATCRIWSPPACPSRAKRAARLKDRVEEAALSQPGRTLRDFFRHHQEEGRR